MEWLGEGCGYYRELRFVGREFIIGEVMGRGGRRRFWENGREESWGVRAWCFGSVRTFVFVICGCVVAWGSVVCGGGEFVLFILVIEGVGLYLFV